MLKVMTVPLLKKEEEWKMRGGRNREVGRSTDLNTMKRSLEMSMEHAGLTEERT